MGRVTAILVAVATLWWLVRRHLRWPPKPWVEVAIIVLCACLFGSIAEDVATGDPLTRVDVRVAEWLEHHRTARLTSVLRAVSWLHGALPLSLATAVIVAWLWHRGERRWMATALLAIPGGMALNAAMKLLFHRARPVVEEPLVSLTTFSFPSGHVAGTTLLYGVVCALVISHTRSPERRLAVVLASLVLIVLVGFSRMYLGAHFLSDVMAAFTESVAWLSLCLAITHGHLGRAWSLGWAKSAEVEAPVPGVKDHDSK